MQKEGRQGESRVGRTLQGTSDNHGNSPCRRVRSAPTLGSLTSGGCEDGWDQDHSDNCRAYLHGDQDSGPSMAHWPPPAVATWVAMECKSHETVVVAPCARKPHLRIKFLMLSKRQAESTRQHNIGPTRRSEPVVYTSDSARPSHHARICLGSARCALTMSMLRSPQAVELQAQAPASPSTRLAAQLLLERWRAARCNHKLRALCIMPEGATLSQATFPWERRLEHLTTSPPTPLL